jgi:hypothetical protein
MVTFVEIKSLAIVSVLEQIAQLDIRNGKPAPTSM